MHELIMEILAAVIAVCVPILTRYIITLIQKSAESVAAKTENAKYRDYIADIASAVSTAVRYTSQTYVDAVKAAGEFTIESQQEALQKSLNTCLDILSEEAKAFIKEVYGDIGKYIIPLIEAEVKYQKGI